MEVSLTIGLSPFLEALLSSLNHQKILTRLDSIDSVLQEMNGKMSKLDDALTALTAKVEAENTEIDSAIVFINGVPKLIADAVAAAIAAGATPEELKAITDLGTSLAAKGDALAAAVEANTGGGGQP